MRYLSVQLDQLEVLGFAKEQSVSFLNLTETRLNNPLARIDILAVEGLYNHAAEVLNEPHLGLRMGHSFRILNYAQTGTIYALCENMKQAIEMNSKYQRIAIDAGDISYDTVGIKGRLGHFLSLTPYDELKTCHHVLNMICGAYATTFDWLGWEGGKGLKSAGSGGGAEIVPD